MLKSIRYSGNKKYGDYIRVLKAIYDSEPVSKLRLKEITRLKHSTLVRIVAWFLDNGIVRAVDTGESTGGRKPALYGVCPTAYYIIGIDIARMYTKAALMDLRCNVVKSEVFGMFEEISCDQTIDRICSLIDGFRNGIDDSKILGVGVGVVGPVDKEKGEIMNPSNFSGEGWESVSLKGLLEKKTGLRVFMDNGVNTAALAEYRGMNVKNAGNIVYITAGIGIRLGVICGGKLLDSAGRDEGAFGHITAVKNGKRCYCGNAGCLEAYVSIPSIIEACRNEIMNGRQSSVFEKADYDLSTVNFDMFCRAVDENDRLALEITENAADHFSTAIANMVRILHPENIILGGPLIQKCQKFLELTIEMTKAKLQTYSCPDTVFSAGNLAEHAAVIGAGYLVVDNFLNFN